MREIRIMVTVFGDCIRFFLISLGTIARAIVCAVALLDLYIAILIWMILNKTNPKGCDWAIKWFKNRFHVMYNITH